MMNEPRSIKEVFDLACKHLVVDERLVHKLEVMKTSFITKNRDHAQFFGGNLIGCYNVKFTPIDRERIFHDILGIDEKDVSKGCDKLIPKKYYQVAGDPCNLALVYIAHVILISSLSERLKENGAAIALELLQYKFITSRMWVHWQYQCSVGEAEATLAALNNKFAIKQKGSWGKLFRDRALDIIYHLHSNTLKTMSPDISSKGKEAASVAYIITDTQTRIRSMLVNIYGIFINIHNQGKKISGDSKLALFDGEVELKDDINIKNKYSSYLFDILKDRNSLIKDQLIDIISSAVPVMNPTTLIKVLEYIPKEISKNKKMTQWVDDIIEHAFSYLGQDINRHRDDLGYLLSRMKGIYTSSRSQDPLLIRIRQDTEKLVKHAAQVKTPAQIAAVRTGLLMYLLLRAFTMSYFSK